MNSNKAPHMRSLIATAIALVSPAAPALAAEASADSAIRSYCEPLIAGSAARPLKEAARKDGFRDEVVAGQPMLRSGEVVVGISDAPRVCIVQAPLAMTRQQGFDLADAWASRHPGAVRSSAATGPDGAPVRAWTVAPSKIALIATHQTTASGQKVMNFILMPLPPRAAARN